MTTYKPYSRYLPKMRLRLRSSRVVDTLGHNKKFLCGFRCRLLFTWVGCKPSAQPVLQAWCIAALQHPSSGCLALVGGGGWQSCSPVSSASPEAFNNGFFRAYPGSTRSCVSLVSIYEIVFEVTSPNERNVITFNCNSFDNIWQICDLNPSLLLLMSQRIAKFRHKIRPWWNTNDDCD